MVEASLYEHLFPFTTVMKQRVVEHFDGDSLCTQRWTTACLIGCTGAFTMVDACCEGFQIATGTTSGNSGTIDFNDINQYNEDNSVIILVVKRACASMIHDYGMVDVGASVGSNTSKVIVNNDTNQTNLRFITHNGCCSTTNVICCLAIDTCWHNVKIVLTACDAEFFLDGVSQNTITTTLPSVALQPIMRAVSRSNGAKSGRIKYLEAYNV